MEHNTRSPQYPSALPSHPKSTRSLPHYSFEKSKHPHHLHRTFLCQQPLVDPFIAFPLPREVPLPAGSFAFPLSLSLCLPLSHSLYPLSTTTTTTSTTTTYTFNTMPRSERKVLIIGTGGTIASEPTGNGYAPVSRSTVSSSHSRYDRTPLLSLYDASGLILARSYRCSSLSVSYR